MCVKIRHPLIIESMSKSLNQPLCTLQHVSIAHSEGIVEETVVITQTYSNDVLTLLGVELMKGNGSHSFTFSTSE